VCAYTSKETIVLNRFFGSIIQKCVSNTNFMPAINKHDCQLIHAKVQAALTVRLCQMSVRMCSKNIDCTDLSASDRFFGLIIQKCVSNTNFMPAIDKHDCQLIHAPRQKSSYLEGLYCSPLRLLVSQTITAHAPSSQVS